MIERPTWERAWDLIGRSLQKLWWIPHHLDESFTFTVDESLVLGTGESATRDNSVVLTLTQLEGTAEALGVFNVFTDNPATKYISYL